MDRNRSIIIINFLDRILEKSTGRWVRRHGKGTVAMCSPRYLLYIHTASKYCDISMSFYPLSHAFFWDAIEEIYNKDASISIHLKIYIFTSVCGLQSIEWGDSGIF